MVDVYGTWTNTDNVLLLKMNSFEKYYDTALGTLEHLSRIKKMKTP